MSEIEVGTTPPRKQAQTSVAEERIVHLVETAAANPGQWVSMKSDLPANWRRTNLIGRAFQMVFGEYTYRGGVLYVRVKK